MPNVPAFPQVIKILHFCNAYTHVGFFIVAGNVCRIRTTNNPPITRRNKRWEGRCVDHMIIAQTETAKDEEQICKEKSVTELCL